MICYDLIYIVQSLLKAAKEIKKLLSREYSNAYNMLRATKVIKFSEND